MSPPNPSAHDALSWINDSPRPLGPKKSPAKPPGQFIREETPRKGRSGSAASQDCL